MASHKSCHARQRPDNKTLYNVMMVSACLSSLTLVGALDESKICKLALVYHQRSDKQIAWYIYINDHLSV